MTSRRFILGTAGHVDHGKTELVRALTGRDTDRLKEEKERGISIELGFAPLRVDDDVFVGIIDVPGHERFVKRMVAGAGGIDLAMLLVAADEGVMPQTEEHMEVLSALAIPAGLVVVSKCDLASEDMMELLDEEVAELTRGTFLEGAPVVRTSARTGDGLDDLRAAIGELARGLDARAATGPFRLAVDRVFHQKGIGVVVTGSGYSGSATVGDSLELMPSGRAVRVRGLESFGEKRDTATAGERIAVALQGAKLDDVARGDMLVTPGHFRVSSALDARVRLADYAAFELKNRERVRIHHGARELLGRVILLESELLASGNEALVQIRLESEVVAAPGDHIVLRKYSPARVIGGGAVIDANPSRHKRFDEDAIEEIRLRERGSPGDVLRSELQDAGVTGLTAGDADANLFESLAEAGDAVRVGDRYFAAATVARLAEAADDLIGEFLAQHPLRWGVDKEELRQRLGYPHGSQSFNHMLEALAAHRPLVVRGNRVRSGDADIALSGDTESRLGALADAARAKGAAFPERGELEKAWTGSENAADAVRLLEDRGELVAVGPSGVMHREALDAVLEALRGVFETADDVGVGDVKDALGLSRRHTIPILEFLDARGVTARAGNRRRRGPAFPESAG